MISGLIYIVFFVYFHFYSVKKDEKLNIQEGREGAGKEGGKEGGRG